MKKEEVVLNNDSKSIKVEPLSDSVTLCVTGLIEDLNKLKMQILTIKDDITSKSLLVTKRIEGLIQSGKVQIDEHEFKQSATSVAQYGTVLDGLCVQIDDEISYFKSFLDEKRPLHVDVPITSSDKFEVIFDERIHEAKRYIKTIGRDLLISASRYGHGFAAQLRRISEVEAMVKSL